ncbi:ABC transporter ATP-binding protein [Candidatus Gracilibacteria bacterium CG17_big_fil_post_rev_8_21_14_2_50_48_13]|nr:MAG: ABC transporter ATP-binding protein [Candidatus Gracilibacteria bacterium CG17_big_fil_post_rev_8_21_14_2_50_48_13]
MATKKYIQLSNVALQVGTDILFQALSHTLQETDRLALVGVNGVGKSTLLRHIAQKTEPYEGSITYHGDPRIGYLSQIHDDGVGTVWEYLLTAREDLQPLREGLARMEEQMQAGDYDEEFLIRYGEVQEQFTNLGGYTLEADIHQALTGLSFAKDLWNAPLSQLSGGQRTKIAFAHILLSSPDFLFLDEPTNFLDMESLEWLEHYLINHWKKGLLIVSHDRFFLDAVTDQTLELIPQSTPELYHLSYTEYMHERERRMALRTKHYEHQQEEIMRQEEIVRRLKSGSRASLAQSRMKMLDKIDRLEKPYAFESPVITFRKAEQSSDLIFEISELWIGYDIEKPLFIIPHMSVLRGQRIVLRGANGCGKTTLLKTLMKELDPLDGYVVTGKHMHVGYYSQVLSHLRNDMSILDEIMDTGMNMTRQQARAFMGRFLFTGDDIFKTIGVLSGGERARVALAKLSAMPTNVLILDEPTNHLDYLAREALEEGLKEYKGTILCISHDRYFIDKIATHLWHVDPMSGELKVTGGNYSDYTRMKQRGTLAYSSPAQEAGEVMLAQIEKMGGRETWERKKKKRRK